MYELTYNKISLYTVKQQPVYQNNRWKLSTLQKTNRFFQRQGIYQSELENKLCIVETKAKVMFFWKMAGTKTTTRSNVEVRQEKFGINKSNLKK